DRLPEGLRCERLLFYGLEGELFFGAEPELEKHFVAIERAAHGEIRVVILALAQARNPDAAFLNSLKEFHNRLRLKNVAFLLCGVQPDLAKALASTGLND